MAVTLMTTTGTLEDVNAALGIAAGSAPTPPEELGPISATVDAVPSVPAEKNVREDGTLPPTEPAPQEATPADATTTVADDQVPDSEFDEDGEPTTERAARSSRTKLQTIKKLRIRAREAELRAARAEGELEARRALTAPPAPVTPPPVQATDAAEPKEADFDTYEAFIEARADYRARKAYREEREKERAEAAQQSQQTAAQQQRQAIADRIQAFEKDHPDYREVVDNPDLILTDAIAYALQTSEDGPAMAYALAKDPDRFKRIAALPPADTMLELGVLRAELRQATPPKADARPATPVMPTAPPPPTPVRGGSVSTAVSLEDFAKTIQPGDAKTSEWIRRRNEQIARTQQR